MGLLTNPWTYLFLILAQLLAIHLNPLPLESSSDEMPFHIHNPFHQHQPQHAHQPEQPQHPGQQQQHDEKREDASTIQRKLLMGYQGWFTAAGDGPPVQPGTYVQRSGKTMCFLTLAHVSSSFPIHVHSLLLSPILLRYATALPSHPSRSFRSAAHSTRTFHLLPPFPPRSSLLMLS